MKTIKIPTLIALLVLICLSLTACGKSEFEVTENTGKKMVITAENASKGSFFMVGSLDVAEGEEVEISAVLVKGEIRVQLIKNDEKQSIEVLPEFGGDPTMSADLHGTDGCSGTVPAGSYSLHAACLQKATGTVVITVTPTTQSAG